MKIDCIGCGMVVLDHLCSVELYPPPNSKNKLLDWTQQGGGPVPTALAVLAKMNNSTVFLGKIGKDRSGSTLRQELYRYGINTDWICEQSQVQTAQAFIVVDRQHQERTVFLHRPEALALTPEDIDIDHLPDCRILHLDGHDIKVQTRLAREMHRRGAMISMDIGSARTVPDTLMQWIDILLVSQDFVKFTSGSDFDTIAYELLKRWQCRIVGITLGEKGSVFVTGEDRFSQPAYEVDAVDSTGAGDVFHGAFLHGLLKGMSYRQAAQFSSAAAALACTQIGGKAGIPFENDVFQFLQTK
jgi:ribokinase